MKIGIDARMYGAKATTGIGVYIKNVTDELFKIDQNNQYVLFMKEPEFSNFTPPNNRISKVKVDIPWYSWAEQWQLPKILAGAKLDLMHFPHFNVPINYRGKYIVTIHDITPKFFPGPKVKKSLVRRLGYKIVFKVGIMRAKKIIAVSNYTKNNLIKYFKTKESKIVVTYLGFNSSIRATGELDGTKQAKKLFAITKPFLFYIGVWRDHKNLPGLINAFTILKTKYHLDYQLVLAGSQDARYPEIKAAIDQSPFKNDIITPGFVAEENLSILYQAAKLFVLPSFTEGFGLVALESQALGTPAAVSNSTSLPEILQDSAVYFDPYNIEQMAEVINKVLNDRNLYTALQQRGLEKAKQYSWRTTAQQTLAVYQNS